jgi:cytochrome c peroxidase
MDQGNPIRQGHSVAKRKGAAAAPKTYEVRERSVRTSDKDARALARPYLLDLYTNDDDEMVCQACHQKMPCVPRRPGR